MRDVDRPAVNPPTERGIRSGVEEPAPQCTCKGFQGSEVGVITLTFAGDGCVNGVVDVVVPLRVQAEPAGRSWRDQSGVVEITFGNQRERSAQMGRQCFRSDGEFLEDVRSGVIDQRVDGVEA